MPARDRRFRKTEKDIKDAFIKITYKKRKDDGNRWPTLEEVLENADINRSTFYLHYPGMEEVEKSVLSDFIVLFEMSEFPTIDEKAAWTVLLPFMKKYLKDFVALYVLDPRGLLDSLFNRYETMMGEQKSDNPYQKELNKAIFYYKLQVVYKWLLKGGREEVEKILPYIVDVNITSPIC